MLQIAGGIWADTVGGKQVLGFGVVWWSIATILTPVAAKLGLPFLLVARAFMGVGEVRIVQCSKKHAQESLLFRVYTLVKQKMKRSLFRSILSLILVMI